MSSDNLIDTVVWNAYLAVFHIFKVLDRKNALKEYKENLYSLTAKPEQLSAVNAAPEAANLHLMDAL